MSRSSQLFTLAALWMVAAAAAAAPQVYWRGESGGFAVEWTESALTAVRKSDAKRFVFVETSPPNTSSPSPTPASAADAAEEDEDQSSTDFRLLSVVGPYVSISIRQIMQLAPSAQTSVYETVGLRRSDLPKAALRLTEIFAEADLLKALSADKVVKKTLKGAGRKAPFTQLADLVSFLAGREVGSGRKTKAFPASEGHVFAEDLLSSASFHHVEKDQVAVRLQIAAGDRKFQEPLQLGLLLKIPDRLKSEFAAAASGQAGFLGVDHKKVIPTPADPVTTVKGSGS